MDKKNMLNFNCSHSFCRPCMQQYVHYELNRFNPVKCPQTGCQVEMKKSDNVYSEIVKGD